MKTDNELAQVPQQQPSIANLIQACIAGGVNESTVSVVERMLALKEKEDDKAARREFNESFVALQGETPNIKATRMIPGNNGTVRSTFAPYEEIMNKLNPLLRKHGFAVSFDTKIDETRIVVTCHLRHRSGHSESNNFAVRIGKGPPGASDAQADGAAMTYAKRYALCAALNITVEGMDADGADPKVEGGPITPELAEKLRSDCLDAGMDLAKVCKWLGVSSFTEIPESKVATLTAKIAEKIAAKEGK